MILGVTPISSSQSVGICVKKRCLRSLTQGVKFTALGGNRSQEHSQIFQYNLKEYKARTSKAIPNDCTMCQVQLQVRDLLNVLPDTLRGSVLQSVTLQLQCFFCFFFFKVKTLNHKNITLTPKGPALEMGLSPCQQQNLSFECNEWPRVSWLKPTHAESPVSLKCEKKGACQEVSEAHTNAPHFHVCTLGAKHAHKLSADSKMLHSQPSC